MSAELKDNAATREGALKAARSPLWHHLTLTYDMPRNNRFVCESSPAKAGDPVTT
jgi:hypothetical protein